MNRTVAALPSAVPEVGRSNEIVTSVKDTGGEFALHSPPCGRPECRKCGQSAAAIPSRRKLPRPSVLAISTSVPAS